MTGNMQPPAGSGRNDSPASAPLRGLPIEYPNGDELAGRMLDCSPGHAKYLRLNLGDIADTIVSAWQERPHVVERFIRRMHEVGCNLPPREHTPQLEADVQLIDQEEDRAQHLWDLERTPQALDRFIRAKHRQVEADTSELRALEALRDRMARGVA